MNITDWSYSFVIIYIVCGAFFQRECQFKTIDGWQLMKDGTNTRVTAVCRKTEGHYEY
jgi:hypothetical protein